MRRLAPMTKHIIPASLTTPASRHSHSHSHGGHGHHSHSHGSIEKNITGKNLRQCQLATIVGGATNVFFCVSKLWVGSGGGSVALVADGFHALTDIVADVISFAAISLAQKELPRCRFPFGIGRLETSGAVFVAAILFFGGVALLVQSLEQCSHDLSLLLGPSLWPLHQPSATAVDHSHDHGHDHSHGEVVDTSGAHHGHSHFTLTEVDHATGSPVILWTMVILAATSVVCKELLFQWTRRVGRRAGSRVVVANAYHHRVDAWSSAVALIGVMGQVAGFPGIDGLAGFVVSISICKIGYSLFRGAVLEFFDYQNAEEVEEIREKLQQFHLRIVHGKDVVPENECEEPSTPIQALDNISANGHGNESSADDSISRKKLRFINVFLVRHGHQYALHVTLLVHEQVPARQIQNALTQLTTLAKESLPIQDTFLSLLLCSSEAHEKTTTCSHDTDRDGDGEAAAHSPSSAAVGHLINPSLERCLLALQKFHTFDGPLQYNWEERTIVVPTSETCDCTKDVESVADIFKCRIVKIGVVCSESTSVTSSSDAAHKKAD